MIHSTPPYSFVMFLTFLTVVKTRHEFQALNTPMQNYFSKMVSGMC